MGQYAMVEQWKDIPGHSGYEVSNMGRVRSYRTRQGHPSTVPRILKIVPVCGYGKVNLGRGKMNNVHKLVLLTFVGPCPDSLQIRHLDGNKLNNNLSNLRYGTAAENYSDRILHGKSNNGSRNGRAKLTEAIAREIRLFFSQNPQLTYAAVGAKYNLSVSIVCRIITGSSWGHAGGPIKSKITHQKVSDDEVRYIRHSTRHNDDLAKELGISPKTVYAIRSGIKRTGVK